MRERLRAYDMVATCTIGQRRVDPHWSQVNSSGECAATYRTPHASSGGFYSPTDHWRRRHFTTAHGGAITTTRPASLLPGSEPPADPPARVPHAAEISVKMIFREAGGFRVRTRSHLARSGSPSMFRSFHECVVMTDRKALVAGGSRILACRGRSMWHVAHPSPPAFSLRGRARAPSVATRFCGLGGSLDEMAVRL